MEQWLYNFTAKKQFGHNTVHVHTHTPSSHQHTHTDPSHWPLSLAEIIGRFFTTSCILRRPLSVLVSSSLGPLSPQTLPFLFSLCLCDSLQVIRGWIIHDHEVKKPYLDRGPVLQPQPAPPPPFFFFFFSSPLKVPSGQKVYISSAKKVDFVRGKKRTTSDLKVEWRQKSALFWAFRGEMFPQKHCSYSHVSNMACSSSVILFRGIVLLWLNCRLMYVCCN